MAGTMHVPRTRGVLSGVLLVLLGLWGGLLPFVGPYADFGFAPDDPWVYDTDRLQLSIAPAIAVGLGGLIVLISANRAFAMFGAWIAVLGGAWFAVGGLVATLWDVEGVGAPLGTSEGRQLAEQLAGFTGLGVVAVFLAALALGRFAVVGVKEARLNEFGEEKAEEAPPGQTDDTKKTQPIVRSSYGRYGRDSMNPPPPPLRESETAPEDQRVAGERGAGKR
ncbi:hypothetical protein [Actinomadura rudentiformis]|uniref:Uncharacterized protein n=1 Tax=Actinomadura rudentiformis TaxID=359158 RepID=A0A6H9YBK3_9ACTN|nr:hypothetical protein [Actinomadura rudentiformis]KAB2342668.1 hypothetical protein F8566_37110 [Actinomadura rudentiformis]